MIFKKFTFSLCLLIAATLTVFAQDDSIPLPTIIQKTAKFAASYPIEKVYLHFDKPYYAVGDTIWFKAYLTVGMHQLSGLSRVVYIDMINNQDSVVVTQKLPVTNGTSAGSIILPQSSFKEGNYRVVAYTAWMRNFDQGYFFTKNMVIGNTADNDNPINTHVSFNNSIKNAVEQINARITYKDQDGVAQILKKVSWKVQADDETIDRGKGMTDQNGVLDITFSSNKPKVFGSAALVTDLELNYKKTITNSFPLQTAANPADVQFFPEGGDLVSGIRSKVAFKAINPKGLGVNVKGTVVDNDNKEVAEFTSQHLGMGAFAFQPEQGKSYKANVTFADGTQNSYDLPRVLDEGLSLSVNNTDPDNLGVKLSANADFLEKFKNTRFNIIGQSGSVVCYAAQALLQNQVYSASIPKSKFPTGILKLTLLSSDGDPLSERLVFIQHNDTLNVAVNTDHSTYTTRQKVRLNLTVKNNNVPVAGSFSLSVVDESKVPFDENSETTILSNLLLTSDLKGYIEKPNYYFNHVDDTRRADLDILMLTQGYRRFSYSDIIIDKDPQLYFLPEQGITLAGMLRTNTGIPVPHGNIHLVIPDKIFAENGFTDESGAFMFNNISLQDSSQVIVSAKNNENGRNMEVTVIGETFPSLGRNINAPDNIVNIDSTISTYLQNSKKQYFNSHLLKEVVIKSTIIEKKPSHLDYSSLIGLSQEPDHLIKSDMLSGCNDLLTCLKVSAMGLTFDTEDFYISRDYNSSGGKKNPVQVYFGGMPVETSYLSNIDPKNVESVEIFLDNGITNIGSLNNTKGILVVNMKVMPKGEKISLAQLRDLIPQKNILTISPLGYARKRDFYVPKYALTKPTGGPTDFRTTVYWNPNIITDKATGKASFEFYNSDNKGNYRAVIEGIDADGNIARYVYHYKVD
jgi:hypothetical protein